MFSQKNPIENPLRMFLYVNHFNSICAPRAAWLGTRPEPETIYPIHAAAVAGSANILRLLLKKGVDSEQLTSMGRSPLDLAEEANHGESHEEVLRSRKMFQKVWDSLWLFWEDSLFFFYVFLGWAFFVLSISCTSKRFDIPLPITTGQRWCLVWLQKSNQLQVELAEEQGEDLELQICQGLIRDIIRRVIPGTPNGFLPYGRTHTFIPYLFFGILMGIVWVKGPIVGGPWKSRW